MTFIDIYDDGCGDCLCCPSGCSGAEPDATCPTNSLGESVCPCTCD